MLRMIRKNLTLVLAACCFFVSMTGCGAQNDDNSASSDTAHETGPAVGSFTVHFNPATECIQQTFEDGTVVDLSAALNLGNDPRWATYYDGRIWYVDSTSLYSCLVDGTDIAYHNLPIRLSLGVSSCIIMNDYFYFIGDSQIESEDDTLYRIPFRVLVDTLSEKKASESEEISYCPPFDISLAETVLEKSDLREYSIYGLAIFQDRLYFDEGWTVDNSDGYPVGLHAFSWVDENGEYGTIFDTPLETASYSKWHDIEYVTDDTLYFQASTSWKTDEMDSLYMAVLSQDNVSFIGLDDIAGADYTEKFMNLLLEYEPDADINDLS